MNTRTHRLLPPASFFTSGRPRTWPAKQRATACAIAERSPTSRFLAIDRHAALAAKIEDFVANGERWRCTRSPTGLEFDAIERDFEFADASKLGRSARRGNNAILATNLSRYPLRPPRRALPFAEDAHYAFADRYTDQCGRQDAFPSHVSKHAQTSYAADAAHSHPERR